MYVRVCTSVMHDLPKDQAAAMSRILDDVLSMQRIEENRLTLEYAPCSIRETVQSIVKSFETAFHNAGLNFVCDTRLTVSTMVWVLGRGAKVGD